MKHVQPNKAKSFAARARRDYKIRSGKYYYASVDELDISPRLRNILLREGIRTAGNASLLSEKEYLAIKGIGPKSVRELTAALREIGTDINHPLTEMSRGVLKAVLKEVRDKLSKRTKLIEGLFGRKINCIDDCFDDEVEEDCDDYDGYAYYDEDIDDYVYYND